MSEKDDEDEQDICEEPFKLQLAVAIEVGT